MTPFRCDCGALVVEKVAKPGRTRDAHLGVAELVPADFPIATCTSCGEELMTLEEAVELGGALRR